MADIMVAMPVPDAEVMARRGEIVTALRRILPPSHVIDAAPALRAYESDGLAAYRQPPLVVALPETTEAGLASAALCP
jgi:glycolate oxidase